ncbi:MAG: SigB/SigF/SigG family RNA polymerase sigma factor [Clostridia bacterium]|nr:SigB/SigF/SigG family RNA polymerase sigma factor [Clostridia bacterium]
MLSVEETLGLIRRAQRGEKEAKADLIQNNSPLVKSVIKRFKSSRIDYDDLYQLGCVGFLKAIKNFNEDFGVKFSTYAVPMIAGEVKRFLRDDGSIKVSRSTKTLAIKINRFVESYQKENYIKPSLSEIGKEFDLSESEVVFTMDSSSSLLSLDERQDNDNINSRSILETVEEEDKSEKMLDLLILKDLLKDLDPRDKHIIIMRYFRDKTQSEIASELGVSQVQVSRLECKILDKMKIAFRVN